MTQYYFKTDLYVFKYLKIANVAKMFYELSAIQMKKNVFFMKTAWMKTFLKLPSDSAEVKLS